MSGRNFKGKVALVTGGASGIGAAAAAAFARAGAQVMIADRDEKGGQALAASLTLEGHEARFFSVDIADAASTRAMVSGCIEAFGGLDHAFNNAGFVDQAEDLTKTGDADWERLVAVNLGGIRHSMVAELDHMAAHGGGTIVNTSSRAGLRGVARSAAYSATKHGIIGLTKSAAVEFGQRGVRVNAICPGLVATPLVVAKFEAELPELEKSMNPMGRIGQPEEIAAAVLWLSSAAASFVTGIALPIDGGANAG